MQLTKGMRCGCGQAAVAIFIGNPACADCIAKDKRVFSYSRPYRTMEGRMPARRVYPEYVIHIPHWEVECSPA